MSLSQEEKFGHLLKPIRELAANWDINIASELEEYLEVLESVTFSVEGSGTVNFAEAALLVQGSAHVYSKKVEYLHQLVYQALDAIHDNKQKQARAAAGGAKHRGDDDDLYDEEQMFLRLDDVLEVGKDIDMDEGTSPQIQRPMPTPAMLLALDSAGEFFGSGAAGSFRISSCVVHESGALLIEPGGACGYDAMLRRVAPRTSPSGAYHTPPVDPNAAGAAPGVGAPCQAPTPPGEAPAGQADAAADGAAPGNEYQGGDDYDDGGGMDWGPDDDCPMPKDASPGRAAEQQRQQQEQQPAAGQEEDEEEDVFDPWAPLDQHDDSGMARKPFRKAKRLPRFKPAPRAPPPCQPGAVPPAAPGKLAFAEFLPALQRAQQARRAAAAQRALAARRSAFVAPPPEPQDDEAQLDDGGDAYDGGDGWGDQGGAEPLSDDDNDYLPLPDAAEPGPAWDADEVATTSAASAAPTYEELCRAHVDAIIAAAAAADVQTGLAARVSTWRQRVQPVIDAQDAREDFDMRKYGQRILQRLAQLSMADAPADVAPQQPQEQQQPAQPSPQQSAKRTKGRKGTALQQQSAPQPSEAPQQDSQQPQQLRLPCSVAPLSAAIGDPEQWQVSRLFAASLQLVNSGNIDFAPAVCDGAAPQVLVHSTEMQDRQKNYRAPSQQHKGGVRSMECDENMSCNQMVAVA